MGRFFFDGCMFALGLYLFTFGLVGQLGSGGYGQGVFLVFVGASLIGGWLIFYGFYRAFVQAQRRVSSK